VTERFITALDAQKFTTPVSGYTVILTGVVSPMTAQALAARGVNVTTKRSPARCNEDKSFVESVRSEPKESISRLLGLGG